MIEENNNRMATNPMELWRQWFEAGTRMWSGVSGGGKESYVDPFGLYRQWFEGLEGTWRQMAGAAGASSGTSPFAGMMNNPIMAALNPATAMAGSSTSQNTPGGPVEAQETAATMGAAEAQNLWKQWFEAVDDSWQQAGKLGTAAVELAPRYAEMLEQMRHNLLSAEGYPTDPLQFATRWYNATNGPLSEFIGELIEREEFLEPSSQLLKSYASFYRVFKRNSEEYLKALQIPVRSDIARVAGLVVALEDKIDRIEEAFEDFEYGYAAPATEESLQAVKERIERLEQSLASAESVGGLENRIAATSESFASVKESINGLERILERIEGGAMTAESLEVVEERISGLERILERIDQGAATAVDERIERLEQSLGRIVEENGAKDATADSIGGLQERIDGVEAKIDRVLAALENAPQNGGATQAEDEDEESNSQTDGEVQATAAARRKAEQEGIDLSSVKGTGRNGQITVDDVRREGQS